MVYTSTIKVFENSHYGQTKKDCEKLLIKSCKKYKIPLAILRLPNLFGKWTRPNYNSVVATFSYNISRNIDVNSNNKIIRLYYIDDLVKFFFKKFILNFKSFNNNKKQTRGEHFHNTKVEKFLLISGKCRFHFKDQNTKKEKIILCDSKKPQIVETIPGWVHKIYNTTNKLAIVMIWTNEVFDANNPDTYAKLIR